MEANLFQNNYQSDGSVIVFGFSGNTNVKTISNPKIDLEYFNINSQSWEPVTFDDWRAAPTTITVPNTTSPPDGGGTITLPWSDGTAYPNPVNPWAPVIPAVMPPAPQLTPEQFAQLVEEAIRRLKEMPLEERQRMEEAASRSGLNPGKEEEKPEQPVKKKPRRMIQT
jgi:hypothetical protein